MELFDARELRPSKVKAAIQYYCTYILTAIVRPFGTTRDLEGMKRNALEGVGSRVSRKEVQNENQRKDWR